MGTDLRLRQMPLNNDRGAIPVVGFGTLIPDPIAAGRAVRDAIYAGFRHFDCAEAYRNEQIVGDAIRHECDTGVVAREGLFVTTKLWNNNHRPGRVRPAFEDSLRRLRLDYLDAYLIHTPFAFLPGDEQYPRDVHGQIQYDTGVSLIETWRAMESLVDDGRCRAIGLSDIRLPQLQEIVSAARIMPAVVQVESHPYLPEWELLEFCELHGIVLLAFAPLGHGLDPRVTDDPVIADIARRVGMTAAQVALSWAAQRGTAFLTTSTSPAHIRENFEIATLPEDAMIEMRERMTANIRFNNVVDSGVPGFIPGVQ